MNQPFTSTVLLTLGRLPVALELARVCHAAGARVVVAEPWRWHLARLSRSVSRCYRTPSPVSDEAGYLQRLLEIVAQESVSRLIPVSEEAGFVAALRERLPASVQLVCIERATWLQLHDKWLFTQLAERLGLSVPRSVRGDDPQAGESLAETAVVLKPRLSCSGTGVHMLDSPAAVQPGQRNADAVLQQQLTGATYCSFSMVNNGQVETTVVYRSDMDYGSVSVTFSVVETPTAMQQWIETLALAVRYHGMLAFDFMQDREGRWCAIECNPRATSGLHLVDPARCWAVLAETPLRMVSAAEQRDKQAGRQSESRADKQGSRSIGSAGDHHDDLLVEAIPAVTGISRQEFWSSLTVLTGRLRSGRLVVAEWRRLFSTKDITWQWRDPLPFLLSAVVMAPILWRSWRENVPIVQLMTLDIGWYRPGQSADE